MDEERILNPTHQVDGWYDGVSLTLIDEVKNLSDQEYVDHLRAFSEDTKFTLLRSERARWQTFRSYWRIDHPILAKSLAKSGFYSLNIGDEVHCIFCRKTFCNWNDGDDPIERHQEVSPKCPFVQGRAQNIPFSSWKLPIERKDDAEAQVTNTDSIPLIPIPEFNDEALAEMVRDARYPDYKLHENRLKSFTGAMCCMCHQRQAKAHFEPCGHRQLCEVCYAAGIKPQNPPRCLLCSEKILDIVLLKEPQED